MDRINKLKGFLEKQPEDNFLRHALALEYAKIGEDSTAIEQLELLLNRDPSYVGSYYQLAKLYERNNNLQRAAQVYSAGIETAKQAGDRHSLNELQMALDDISDL